METLIVSSGSDIFIIKLYDKNEEHLLINNSNIKQIKINLKSEVNLTEKV